MYPIFVSTSSLLTMLPFKLYGAYECFLSHFALKIRAAAVSKFKRFVVHSNVTATDIIIQAANIKNCRFKHCRTEETEFSCWPLNWSGRLQHHCHALFVFVIALIISIYFYSPHWTHHVTPFSRIDCSCRPNCIYYSACVCVFKLALSLTMNRLCYLVSDLLTCLVSESHSGTVFHTEASSLSVFPLTVCFCVVWPSQLPVELTHN